MLKILFCLLFVISFPSLAYADNFFPDGELDKNMYFDTGMFGISNLPNVGNCPGCIEYDKESVNGSYSNSIIPSTFIDGLTYSDEYYGLVRVPRLYDRVSVPPFSTVDFIYLYKNSSGESVNITELGLFLSQGESNGLESITDLKGNLENIQFKYGPYNLYRSGLVKRYEGIGIVNNSSGGSVILDTMQVLPPLVFQNWGIEFTSDGIDVSVTVKNNTVEVLNNILYEHGGFSLKRNFNAYEEYTYEYVLPMTDKENIGYPSISVPNVRQVCAVIGEPMESIIPYNSAILYGVREKNGKYLNYISSRVKPYPLESFCITRIPFKLYAQEFILKDDVNTEEEESTVLGVTDVDEITSLDLKQLPQTGNVHVLIYLTVFLVVVVILCYYHIRRSKK